MPVRFHPLSLLSLLALFFFLSGPLFAANSVFDVIADAVTDADADVDAASVNDTDTEQTGEGNQDIHHAADAAVDAELNGDLMAENIAAASQDGGSGQTNQSGIAELIAALGADVAVEALSANDIGLTQIGGDGNQAIANDVAGTTSVDSSTDGMARNIFVAEQEAATDTQANQTLDAAAAAVAFTDALARGTTINLVSIEQEADDDDGGINQDVENTVASNVIINAINNTTAMNILSLLQECNGQCNQVAMIDAMAVAGGAGMSNQNADTANVATADVDANQEITGLTAIGLEQSGSDGQGNLMGTIETDTVAGGSQTVNGAVVIAAGVEQDSDGEMANQDVAMANAVDLDIDVGQDVSALTLIGAEQQSDASNLGSTAQALEIDAETVALAGQDVNLDTALRLETKAIQLLFSSQDQKEGAKAFMEKRTPKWQGK